MRFFFRTGFTSARRFRLPNGSDIGGLLCPHGAKCSQLTGCRGGGDLLSNRSDTRLPSQLSHCRVVGRKRPTKRHPRVRPKRPRNLRWHAGARDEFNFNGIPLREPEGPLKLKTAVRIVDDRRALKAPAAVDKDMSLHRPTLGLAVHIWGSGLLHGSDLCSSSII